MFKAGDQVRCIDARGSAKLLRLGDRYVVAAAVGGFVFLEGLPDWRPGFYERRFQRATDISTLTALLATARDLVPA